MKNLEQIRAKHALDFWHPAQGQAPAARGVNQGDVISKLPSLILANGLLATAAFCNSEGGGENRAYMKKALNATADHLAKQGHLAPGTNTVAGMIEDLCKRSSHELQRATAEALAFIAYLKRFAPKD